MSISYEMGRLAAWLSADEGRSALFRAKSLQNMAKLDLTRPDETKIVEPKHRVALCHRPGGTPLGVGVSFDLAEAIALALSGAASAEERE